MKKSLVKEKLSNLYVNFGEKWMENSQIAQLHKNAGRDEQSSFKEHIAYAYRDCMNEVLIVMSDLGLIEQLK